MRANNNVLTVFVTVYVNVYVHVCLLACVLACMYVCVGCIHVQVCVHESLLLWFPILQLAIFGNTSDGMWQVRMESVTDLVIHVHTCARTHTNLHTHTHTHTHTQS